MCSSREGRFHVATRGAWAGSIHDARPDTRRPDARESCYHTRPEQYTEESRNVSDIEASARGLAEVRCGWLQLTSIVLGGQVSRTSGTTQ